MILSSFCRGLPWGMSCLGKMRLRLFLVNAMSSPTFLKNRTGAPVSMALRNCLILT